MSKRFSMAEVTLARRIKEKADSDRIREAANAREESLRDMFQRIMDAPLVPSYGNEPPWWEQAVAEADQGMIWVTGYGWMGRDLWDDILKCSEEEEKRRKRK